VSEDSELEIDSEDSRERNRAVTMKIRKLRKKTRREDRLQGAQQGDEKLEGALASMGTQMSEGLKMLAAAPQGFQPAGDTEVTKRLNNLEEKDTQTQDLLARILNKLENPGLSSSNN